jgi:glycosyltransferase involved in cell wall biosynthesis
LSVQNGVAPKRILVLCRATFGARMSSPGIRSLHMAEVLAQELPDAQVTLAVPAKSELPDPATVPFRVETFKLKTMLRLIREHDIVISNDYPPLALAAFPWKTFVLDYYTIYFIEWMENSRDSLLDQPRRRNAWMSGARRRIGAELLYGDLITCANDRQRDYYIGALIGLGLIDPQAYDRDPSMRHLIESAGHGIRPQARERRGPYSIRGVYAGIKQTDKLIVWNGGILQWYDPISLLHAMAKIKQQRDDVKLVFIGGAYPGLGGMGLGKRFQETVDVAKDLGIYNNTVFFDVSWVPYDRMRDLTLEADLAVCTYFDNLETHFSLRTRFVDVFWAEIPLICTQGDVYADMVREKQMGITVPQEDVDAIAAAILKLLDDREFYEACKRNIREQNKQMGWNTTLQPLVEFCRDPQTSALPKWRRTIMLIGAWAQWVGSRAIGVWAR